MEISSISSLFLKEQVSSLKQNKVKTFSEVFNSCKIPNDLLKKNFNDMKLTINVGTINVSKEKWNRNDFPIWELFNDNVDTESINKWQPSAVAPRMTDTSLQKKLNTINSGELSIIIPDNVYKSMQEDEQYASKLVENIKQWKYNYDISDNAIAASYGANAALYQMSKSYCITLDKNGNVSNHTVISDSINVSKINQQETNSGQTDIHISDAKYKKTEKAHEKRVDEVRFENYDIAENSFGMGVIATAMIKERKNK